MSVTVKRLLWAGASLLVLCGAASAADLPTRKEPAAPPPMVLPWTWTGFYGGLNIGTAWASGTAAAYSNANNALLATASSNTGGTFLGGGQVGYLYQFPGNFVVGAQFALDGATNRTVTNPFFNTSTSGRIAFSAVGEVGYAFGDFLPFLLGGWNGATQNINVTHVPTGLTYSTSVSGGGGTFGGGVDWHVGGNWFVDTRYQYTWGSRYSYNFPAAGFRVNTSANTQGVYLGVNYKF